MGIALASASSQQAASQKKQYEAIVAKYHIKPSSQVDPDPGLVMPKPPAGGGFVFSGSSDYTKTRKGSIVNDGGTACRRRLGWKPSHEIRRRRPGFHHSFNRIIREKEREL